jgi:hypothetical protein
VPVIYSFLQCIAPLRFSLAPCPACNPFTNSCQVPSPFLHSIFFYRVFFSSILP